MKKTLKIIALVLFAVFIVIQFVRPDFTNPVVISGQNLESSVAVPENVEAILTRSCKDCHSNETSYPWYSKIQPAAWFLADHISEGRNQLNLSIWNTYETRRKSRKLNEMCEQITEREMPLPSYLWIHRSAKLSDEEIKTICDWAKSEQNKLNSAEKQ